MTPAELDKALHTLRLSQRGAAKLFKVNERSVRSWIQGRHPIPGAVEVALRLMIRFNVNPTEDDLPDVNDGEDWLRSKQPFKP